MTHEDTYIIKGGLAGRDRLRVLGRALQPTTTAFLERVGVATGAACLDVGCGGGDVSLLLAEAVGPSGRVVGLDLDAEKMALASAEAKAAQIHHIEYRVGTVQDLDDRGTYDVVYSRFLLTHLPDPAGALRNMVSAARPGGVVTIEDIDFGGSFCYPDNAAYERYCELYTQAALARGVDPYIGRRLPSLLADAGLTNIVLNVESPASFNADVKAVSPLTLENIADAAVAAGLVERDEMNELITEIWAFAGEPMSILSLPRIVQVHGTVPG
ncbi:unannotated protein [freshwater metagenome]|uniref:Unannotated protein n=1 Tax=freshwater metagenome TaxID=449393 RepID=A0A6J7FIP4_9ZZZZ|nr:methyltransferase domain-containing protein [Actinomycetota bacterium]